MVSAPHNTHTFELSSRDGALRRSIVDSEKALEGIRAQLLTKVKLVLFSMSKAVNQADGNGSEKTTCPAVQHFEQTVGYSDYVTIRHGRIV